MDDLELLRRHEPVVQFTQGELFFPMAANRTSLPVTSSSRPRVSGRT